MSKRRATDLPTAKAPPSDDHFSVRHYRIVQVLVGLAALIAIYLLTISWSGHPAAGCGPDSSCHRVLTSRWAYWLGVPVSLLALLAYAGVLCATFAISRGALPLHRPAARALLTGLAVTIAGSAGWFVGVQVFVLRSVCPYCMAAHTLGLIAASILL